MEVGWEVIERGIETMPLKSVVAMAAATVPILKIHIGTSGRGTTLASTYRNTPSSATPMMSGARRAADIQGMLTTSPR